MKRLIIIGIISIIAATSYGFTYDNGRASLSPYPECTSIPEYPDSLTPIFINHVGRHGSRYPAGSFHTMTLKKALDEADSLNTITPLGKQLKEETERVIEATAGRWGELDTIGEKEHREIAGRMHQKYPQLLDSANISAISSDSPRSIMSMYFFTQQLAKSAEEINITTESGSKFTPLMRNYELDEAYQAYRNDTAYTAAYNRFAAANIPIEPILRVLGEEYPLDYSTVYDLALAEYYVSAGMNAMGLEHDASKYFTIDEYHKLWSVFNFRQYLLYSASLVSTRPAEIAAPLLQNIVATADSVVTGKLHIAAKLRFGHAETLMPLMALIQAPGCYYLTHYYDTLADNWKDYEMFPMAANLQLVYFKAPSGKIYVRAEYNEKPIQLLPGAESQYVDWNDLRLRFLELLPLE